MIAVDTNLLVGLLTKDDLGQAKRAAKIADKFATFDNALLKKLEN